jgi:succinate dehydrogenase/fumarate reductase cytochrome b subunit
MSTDTMTETAASEAQPREGAHHLAWRRAQAASGLLIAIFLGIHLLNVPLGAFPGAYDAYQRVMRQLYQSPFFEIPFLVVPILVHVTAGLRAILRSKTRSAAKTWPQRLHRWSAWMLLLSIGGHYAATRGPSLVAGVYPEQLGLAFALWWIPLFFWPYYVLLGLSGLVHVGWGVPRALSVLRRKPDHGASSRPLAIALAIGAPAKVLGELGIGGAL